MGVVAQSSLNSSSRVLVGNAPTTPSCLRSHESAERLTANPCEHARSRKNDVHNSEPFSLESVLENLQQTRTLTTPHSRKPQVILGVVSVCYDSLLSLRLYCLPVCVGFCGQGFARRDVLVRHLGSCKSRLVLKDGSLISQTVSKAQRGRKSSSCIGCVRAKRACSGIQPCLHCVHRKQRCHFNF